MMRMNENDYLLLLSLAEGHATADISGDSWCRQGIVMGAVWLAAEADDLRRVAVSYDVAVVTDGYA